MTATRPVVEAPTTTDVQPIGTVALKRRTIDSILIGVGLVAAVVFVIAGALLTWGSRFADDYVGDELASQNITFPDAEALTEPRVEPTCSSSPDSSSTPATRPRPTPATSTVTSPRSPAEQPTPSRRCRAGGQGRRHRRRRRR